MKPSELLHSLHRYLVDASYTKSAAKLKKEAMLEEAGAPETLVPLEAATATWSKKMAKSGASGASAEDLPRSVHQFLSHCQLTKAAKALMKEADVGGDGGVVPLLEAAALHLKKQKKAAKKGKAAAVAAPPLPEATKAKKKKKAARGSDGARAAPPADSDGDGEEEEEEAAAPAAAAPKKTKTKKRKRSLSEDERQAEARAAAEKKKRDDAAEAMNAWLAKNEATPKQKSPKTPGSARSPGTPFERIDNEKWMNSIKDDRLKDNSYEGTYGDGGWGAKASQKLVQVRGKDFRHEKTKKKRGGYRGGTVDMGSNSIKYHYDSDE